MDVCVRACACLWYCCTHVHNSKTARMFNVACNFFDVLKQFGELDADVRHPCVC